MQISSIGNHQTNFNGQLCFNTATRFVQGKRAIIQKLALNSDDIVAIERIDHITEGIKTAINMRTGVRYLVDNRFEDVVKAKSDADGTNLIIDLNTTV